MSCARTMTGTNSIRNGVATTASRVGTTISTSFSVKPCFTRAGPKLGSTPSARCDSSTRSLGPKWCPTHLSHSSSRYTLGVQLAFRRLKIECETQAIFTRQELELKKWSTRQRPDSVAEIGGARVPVHHCIDLSTFVLHSFNEMRTC